VISRDPFVTSLLLECAMANVAERVSLVALLALGCGASAKPATNATVPAASQAAPTAATTRAPVITCEGAAASIDKALAEPVVYQPGEKEFLLSIAPVMKAVLAERCKVDHWSQPAIACVAAIDSFTEEDECDQLLTAAQNQSLQDALNVALEPLAAPQPTTPASSESSGP
jgi:hypothetical protein